MAQQSDSGQERTEEATPRRRERAFQEGRIPRSQELSSAVILLGGVGAIAFGGGASIARSLLAFQQTGAEWITLDPLTEGTASGLLRTMGWQALLGAAPMVLGISALALGVNAVQARGVFSTQPMVPKLSHLSPLGGLKRILSLQSVVNLLKSILKLVFLATVAYVSIVRAWPEVLTLSNHEPVVVVAVIEAIVVKLGLAAGLAFLFLSLGDYLFQVYQHGKQLRMTRQEVTQEFKETEGDPLMKSRIKSIALAMSRRRMLKDVETADVVITNPTHLAIALKYDADVAAAPVVVAMGARKMALRIKAAAMAAGVPCFENKPLAQSLMATANVGEPIPPALYMAVAEVIAFVYRRRGQHAGNGAAQ